MRSGGSNTSPEKLAHAHRSSPWHSDCTSPTHRMPTSAHSGERPGLGARVYAVQRSGAIIVALFLLAFGLLGFASGQAFFSTRGSSVLGMSSNGLLSTLSVVVGVVPLVA